MSEQGRAALVSVVHIFSVADFFLQVLNSLLCGELGIDCLGMGLVLTADLGAEVEAHFVVVECVHRHLLNLLFSPIRQLKILKVLAINFFAGVDLRSHRCDFAQRALRRESFF